MRIDDFAVETWMNAHETKCRHNIAETCVDSITFGDLMTLTGRNGAILDELAAMKLTYGAIEGSAGLRSAIATLYSGRRAEEVLVTHGAAGANALLYETLVEPGDEIVCFVPTYQQHVSIPESYGAVVKRLWLRAERRYLPDLDELASVAGPKTKLIALTNPNNPTGALIDEALLRGIVEIAERRGAWVIADEVYRGLNQANDGLSPSIAELYARGIAVGSMSKAFALAGLRLGWIVAPPELLRRVMVHRDYNTISVGMIDDHIARIALEHREALLARNRQIVRTNLAILDDWMAGQPRLSWVKPSAGTVTLLSYDLGMPSTVFCQRLLAGTGVLLVPGSAFEMEGCFRLGFGNATASLQAGLEGLSGFLETTAAVAS
jgi:aspartate/methionine/tyrosine aminotransferase